MTKNERIFKLFSSNFECDDFRKNGPAKGFSCRYEKECNVNKNDQPIWSAAVGDENTSVMIVGEAPSKTGGLGPHIGGLFANWKADKRSPVDLQRTFVQKYYHTTPYFTDLAKCGVARQRDKKALNRRKERCTEYLLVKEIQIIEPKIILCSGRISYSVLTEYQKENKIDRSIQLVHLMHYSRQAGLPLNVEDKLEIVWKWQTGLISPDEIKKIPLSALSYFQREL